MTLLCWGYGCPCVTLSCPQALTVHQTCPSALYRGNGAEAHCLLLASVGHPLPMPAFTQPWVSQLVHQSRASPEWSYLPYNLPQPTGRARSWGQCSSVHGELLHLNADCLELGVSLMGGESPPTSTSPLSSQ